MKKSVTFILIFLLVISTAVYGYNYSRLQSVMDNLIAADDKNEGIQVSVHYDNYFNPLVLVFDLQFVAERKSMADVFRIFLQFAQKKQFEKFKAIKLSFRGKTKFIINGGYFRELGREYLWQNPDFTMKDFPLHLKTPDGSEVYPQLPRQGDFAWVSRKQLQNFNDFIKKWYREDLDRR